MTFLPLLLSIVFISSVALAAPHPQLAPSPLENRQLVPDPYAPSSTSCPQTELIRSADGISSDEANYLASRKPKADQSLAAWLKKQGNFDTSNLPSVALTASGGGYRAFLEAAGVIKAFDDRDGDSATSGLFQALTYQAGLSGGAWFLGSFAGNNYPTVSDLAESLWAPSFDSSLLLPSKLLDISQYIEIGLNLAAKVTAGFAPTIVDAWGRLLSYQFLDGDGGDTLRMSTLTTMDKFTKHSIPYPIMTALGVDESYFSQCFSGAQSTQYEFHPFEYGSWDDGVQAFARSQYMGSDLTNGKPTHDGNCITNYDNIGYIFGTSSNIFNAVCAPLQPLTYDTGPLTNLFKTLVNLTHAPTFMDFFGVYPNPFYQFTSSPTVSQNKLLTMVDGGGAGQNVLTLLNLLSSFTDLRQIPIWPFIQPARNVDVLFTCDNGADIDNFPNGTALRNTYVTAQSTGLTKMPYIPDAAEFVAKGLDKRAAFFGCDSANTVLIINLPNVNYTFPSNQDGLRIQFKKAETMGMIDNGVQIALQNGDKKWPFCLACGIKYKDGVANLPKGCDSCLQKYCYSSS